MKKIKTREWLLITILLLILEYLVMSITLNFGDNKSLVNYVSFAGTIMSIVLALVAIIYSFIQSESQSRSSSNISAEVASLRTVVQDINKSKVTFSGELDRFADLANEIKNLREISVSSNQEIKNIANISNRNMEISHNINKMINYGNNDKYEDKNDDTFIKIITSSPHAILLAFSLSLADDNKHHPITSFISNHYSIPLDQHKFFNNNKDSWLEIGFVLLMIFSEFNLIKLEDNDDENYHSFIITEEFKRNKHKIHGDTDGQLGSAFNKIKNSFE